LHHMGGGQEHAAGFSQCITTQLRWMALRRQWWQWQHYFWLGQAS
jgi:hypothetical protein